MAEQLCSKSFLSRALNLSSFPVLLLLLVQNVVIHVLFCLFSVFSSLSCRFNFPPVLSAGLVWLVEELGL